MSKKPKQARSIESTNRMLDAAESLLREGGPRAITIEAVIERSGTSMGSFYARFDSREGLFQALHERFLSYVVEEDLFHQLENAITEPDLASALGGAKVRVAQNADMVADKTALIAADGDEIAFLPPVSGG